MPIDRLLNTERTELHYLYHINQQRRTDILIC